MSEFVVKTDIPFGSALAYTRGQKIDADAVKRNKWEDYVVGANTKEARQILAEVTGEPLAEDDAPAKTAAKSSTPSTETKG